MAKPDPNTKRKQEEPMSKDELRESPMDHQIGKRGNCHALLRNVQTGRARPDWKGPKP